MPAPKGKTSKRKTPASVAASAVFLFEPTSGCEFLDAKFRGGLKPGGPDPIVLA